MADVSRRSGVSVGSLYHHFGSREGMIDKARARQFGESFPGNVVEEAQLLLTSPTPVAFVERVRALLGETPERTTIRRRRLETIATAARRPGHLRGVVAIRAHHLDLGERMARGLIARGCLRDGVDPRAFALLLDVMAMSGSLREVDLHPVTSDAWGNLVGMCIEGLLVS